MNSQYIFASQVAEMLGEKWSRQRVHTQVSRGTFPLPSMKIGKQPVWTVEQIEKYMKEKGIRR